MSHSKSRMGKGPLRRLGSVRKNALGFDSIPKFPPLTPTLDKHYDGIHGNAMSVPPPRGSPDCRSDRSIPRSPTRTLSSSRTDQICCQDKMEQLAELNKEYREALSRERQLQQQLSGIQALVAELRSQITEKEQTIFNLQAELQKAETKYKELYNTELGAHATTKEQLSSTVEELQMAKQRADDLQKQHVREMTEYKLGLDRKLAELELAKDKEIKIRDDKLNRLKSQMAESLKGNSWERQQQLDELTKELHRLQEESDMLRLKVKALQRKQSGAGSTDSNNKQNGHCVNCAVIAGKLEKTEKMSADKDKSIKELKSLCARFEKQLNQQDVLLKQFAESQGHKVLLK